MTNFISSNQIESTGPTLTLGGSTSTTTINLGTSNAAQVINFGTGSAAKTINIGSSNDTVVMAGSVIHTQTTNLDVTDKQIILNKGGASGSGFGVGFQIEEAGVITGSFAQNANRDGYALQPSNGTLINLNQSLSTTDTPHFAGVTASTFSGNLNATTATSTVVNATVVNATNLNASNAITGNLTGNCSGSSLNFTQPLTGDVINGNGTSATTVAYVGGVSAAQIANAVNNPPTSSGTVAATPNTIVQRDNLGETFATRVNASAYTTTPTLGTNRVESLSNLPLTISSTAITTDCNLRVPTLNVLGAISQNGIVVLDNRK
jgi:hypothetical protein